MSSLSHQPVLLRPFLALAAPAAGQRWIDGTFGRGGHARALLERGCLVLALDRDAAAVAAAETLQKEFPSQMSVARSDFREIGRCGADLGWDRVDGVLLDLGVSSPQFDDPARGFSFRHEAPLDMRMDQRQELTAAAIVNEWNEEPLADLFYNLAEERDSRRIARAIVRRRDEKPVETTADLAQVVADAVPHRKGKKVHPATQVFQALRMAVNGEREALDAVLPEATALLAPGAPLAVISFHSGEDRRVKEFMREGARVWAETPDFVPAAPNPARIFSRVERALPDAAELEENPRARSARLRVAWKLENPS
jgi:16S rRNA (cytosine1402-N4)-methyltransferase